MYNLAVSCKGMHAIPTRPTHAFAPSVPWLAGRCLPAHRTGRHIGAADPDAEATSVTTKGGRTLPPDANPDFSNSPQHLTYRNRQPTNQPMSRAEREPTVSRYITQARIRTSLTGRYS